MRGTTSPADSRDMYVVHAMLRRGFDGLPALVRGVPTGARRATLVADHAALLVTILVTHHEAEDAVLWPRLRERCPDALTPVVASMEQQHQALHAGLESITDCAARYRSTRGEGDREELARSVEGVLAPLHEHLSAEERDILPLIDRYLTNAEWAAVGEHGLPQLAPVQVPLVFGMMLEVAGSEERRLLAANVPAEIFAKMVEIAPSALAAYERELHGDGAV